MLINISVMTQRSVKKIQQILSLRISTKFNTIFKFRESYGLIKHQLLTARSSLYVNQPQERIFADEKFGFVATFEVKLYPNIKLPSVTF